MNRDQDHLRLLSVFHYVMGGLVACCSCFPLFSLTFGILLATGRIDDHDPDAGTVGVVLSVLSAVTALATLAFAVGVILSGIFLSQRRHYTFCLVIAALLCLNAPLGTVLGVLTIMVLMRESVRQSFGKTPYSG
jgi:hypothetical protein